MKQNAGTKCFFFRVAHLFMYGTAPEYLHQASRPRNSLRGAWWGMEKRQLNFNYAPYESATEDHDHGFHSQVVLR